LVSFFPKENIIIYIQRLNGNYTSHHTTPTIYCSCFKNIHNTFIYKKHASIIHLWYKEKASNKDCLELRSKINFDPSFFPFLFLTLIHLLEEGSMGTNYKLKIGCPLLIWCDSFLSVFHFSQWGFICNYHPWGEISALSLLYPIYIVLLPFISLFEIVVWWHATSIPFII